MIFEKIVLGFYGLSTNRVHLIQIMFFLNLVNLHGSYGHFCGLKGFLMVCSVLMWHFFPQIFGKLLSSSSRTPRRRSPPPSCWRTCPGRAGWSGWARCSGSPPPSSAPCSRSPGCCTPWPVMDSYQDFSRGKCSILETTGPCTRFCQASQVQRIMM